jgi:hypothetical protein
LFVFATAANADLVESWICQKSSNGDWSQVIATASINKGREDGEVEIFAKKNIAYTEFTGTNKIWKFGPTYEYAFVIKPDGEAMYYDHSKEPKGDAEKSQINLFCKQKELAEDKELAEEKAPDLKIRLPEETPSIIEKQ